MKQLLIILTLTLICNTITIGQNNKRLILAPQNDDVIYVNESISTINILLAVDEKIDSTVYYITSMNRFRQKSTEKFIAVDDSYTLELPVNIGSYSQIEIITYQNGKIQKEENFQVFFRQKNSQFMYVLD